MWYTRQMTAFVLSLLISMSQPQQPMTTHATRYADTARDEGGTPACKHHLPRQVFELLHPIRVAHRTLPCGTLLVVQNGTGRRVLAAVLDRGPWGRVRQATGLPEAPRGRSVDVYRGSLDLSPGPASALGLTLYVGRLPVTYWPAEWQPFVKKKTRWQRLAS